MFGWMHAAYAFALLSAFSIWFIAIRAPLWQDETGSYWDISNGFSHIWTHRIITLCFPSYNYVLWFSTKIIGTSELALRLPSLLAMLGAVCLLYLAARELFSRELAFFTAIIFCLHPIVIFESIDIRPYAFGALATTAAILILFRLRRSESSWLAALFGLTSALIVSFHYLFAVILPAFVLCFFLLKAGNRKVQWRQFGIAAAVFALAFLPMIHGLLYLFRTSGSHVYERSPGLAQLSWTVAAGLLPWLFGGAVIVSGILAASARERGPQSHIESWKIATCASLMLIPLLILFIVSVATPIHMFADRHRLVAIPGVALCWPFLIERYLKRPIRLLLCVTLVMASAWFYWSHPSARQHEYTWKYALQVAEKNASIDHAPVVICSDFPEADYVPMPLGSAKTSRFFAQLSYYKLSVPVVPLPRALNAEAMRVGSEFLHNANDRHERFLAMAFRPSYPNLSWLARQASPNFTVRSLGTFDDIEVLEFTPARSSIIGKPLPR